MNSEYILITGSASRSCPKDKLDAAVEFVRSFTEETLSRGGGIVVLAGGEESTKSEQGTPCIFDWVALREVGRYAEITTKPSRPYARIVMSDEAPESKIDDANLQLLRNLEQRNIVERFHIRREVYTGGQYREVMTQTADAMVALGGGKGTYSAGTMMTGIGKPVLPVDLPLGSIVEDGEGAVALHREMVSNPERFFPNTSKTLKNKLGLLSLDRGINEPGTAAQAAAEMLEAELQAIPVLESTGNAKRRLAKAWRFLKEIPMVAAVIKIFEFLRGLLPFM